MNKIAPLLKKFYGFAEKFCLELPVIDKSKYRGQQ